MAPSVEERERLREEVGHQAVAEIAQDVLPDLMGETDAPVEGDVGDDEEDREQGQGPKVAGPSPVVTGPLMI